MADKNVNKRLAELRERIEKKKNSPPSRRNILMRKIKYRVGIGAAALALIAGIGYKDYVTKRQDYPERNVLFRSSNVTNIVGNTEGGTATKADIESVTKFYEGGGIESKVGTYLCETIREVRGDIDYYNMDNSQKIRIASATQKPEIFQAGFSLKGSLNYREQFAEIVIGAGDNSKAPQKYTVYKITPERGFQNKDIDVVENVNGAREIINRLIEPRNLLGFFFGKKYRDGTILEDYSKTAENLQLEKETLEKIKHLDSPEAKGEKTREDILAELTSLEERMDNITIYSSFEDGFFKLMPQESTLYLGSRPSLPERIKHWAGFGRKEKNRLVVENYLDIWPGYIPLLSEISLGSGKNKIYPFDKYNNGGYLIKDKYGKVAQINIEDFAVRYGQDVLYSYFLDLNGDGELDDKELIGQVLCRTTHDERKAINEFAARPTPDRNLTYTINFSFMAPDIDLENGFEKFKLCAYLESMIPDQIHRGNGQHSLLYLINEQRSDLILYKDLSIGNLSRALTQESTLTAKYDIIKVLNAAKRPYAQELAKLYRIEREFEGQFQNSSLLRERTEIGPLPGIALAIGALSAGYYYLKKRKTRKKTTAERLALLQNPVDTK